VVTQNIYDDPGFYESYSRLPRSREGLAGAPEWPALRALLPDLKGLAVVDLGCGYGWFCRWAAAQGAARVLGLDASEKMLERARSSIAGAEVSYGQADLEHLDLPEASFDVAYSSLAFHYIANFAGLLATVWRALVPGGRLVFSIEHPIFMAPTHPGWRDDADGRPIWPLDGYLREGPRTTDWLANGVVKQHRTLGTTLNLLFRTDFTILHVGEWGPTDAQIEGNPDWERERERPMFLLVSARRGARRGD
jgi:SAM-dependent methyltransferase